MHPKKIVNHVCDPTPLCNISCCKFVDHCLPDLAWSSPSLLITSTIPRFCDAMIISTTTCLGTSPYLGAYTKKKKKLTRVGRSDFKKDKNKHQFCLKKSIWYCIACLHFRVARLLGYIAFGFNSQNGGKCFNILVVFINLEILWLHLCHAGSLQYDQ